MTDAQIMAALAEKHGSQKELCYAISEASGTIVSPGRAANWLDRGFPAAIRPHIAKMAQEELGMSEDDAWNFIIGANS